MQLLRIIRRFFAICVIAGAFVWSAGIIAMRRVAENPPETITIRIGHWQLETSIRDAFNEIARDYQRDVNPHVRIVQDVIPETIYGQWATTQLMGGTAPDVVEIWKGFPRPVWVSYLSRYFMPITSDISGINPHNKGDVLEQVAFRQTYKDAMRNGYIEELQEYMIVPLSQMAIRVFYNRDLLRRLTGSDEAPKDYRSFLRACELIASKADAAGKHYTPVALSGPSHFYMWEQMIFDTPTYSALRKLDFNRDGYVGNDELYVGFRSGRIDMNYPGYRAKFQMVRELSKYFQNGYTGLSRDEAVFQFAQQRAVFMSTGTWDARSLQEQARGHFEIGVMPFPLPAPDDPEYGKLIEGPAYEQVMIGLNFAITRTCKHPEVALDFLKYLASRRMNQKFNDMIGWIPAIHDTELSPLLKGFEPQLEGVYGCMNLNLGGETAVRWWQLYSLYQVNQISYEQLVREFQSFYIERGERDFQELARDWRRQIQGGEQFLAGIRASAMSADASSAPALWAKYREMLASRQLRVEIEHARQMKQMRDGVQPDATGPYEYSEKVKEIVRRRRK